MKPTRIIVFLLTALTTISVSCFATNAFVLAKVVDKITSGYEVSDDLLAEEAEDLVPEDDSEPSEYQDEQYDDVSNGDDAKDWSEDNSDDWSTDDWASDNSSETPTDRSGTESSDRPGDWLGDDTGESQNDWSGDDSDESQNDWSGNDSDESQNSQNGEDSAKSQHKRSDNNSDNTTAAFKKGENPSSKPESGSDDLPICGSTSDDQASQDANDITDGDKKANESLQEQAIQNQNDTELGSKSTEIDDSPGRDQSDTGSTEDTNAGTGSTEDANTTDTNDGTRKESDSETNMNTPNNESDKETSADSPDDTQSGVPEMSNDNPGEDATTTSDSSHIDVLDSQTIMTLLSSSILQVTDGYCSNNDSFAISIDNTSEQYVIFNTEGLNDYKSLSFLMQVDGALSDIGIDINVFISKEVSDTPDYCYHLDPGKSSDAAKIDISNASDVCIYVKNLSNEDVRIVFSNLAVSLD